MAASAPDIRTSAVATIVSPAATTARVPSRSASFADSGPPSTSPSATGVMRSPAASGS